MKAASLKDKPERREWEEAADFFKWTCGEYNHVQRARSLENFHDRLAAAQAMRHDGNQSTKCEELDEALLKYFPLHMH